MSRGLVWVCCVGGRGNEKGSVGVEKGEGVMSRANFWVSRE